MKQKQVALGCDEVDLILDNVASGKSVTYRVKHARDSLPIIRCINSKPSVYTAIVVNSKYFAFETSEPGWIFFDRKEERFLPFVVNDDMGNLGSILLVSPDGRVFLESRDEVSKLTGYYPSDRVAVREVIFQGKSLKAPIELSELLPDSASKN